jgi:hypothetical protein
MIGDSTRLDKIITKLFELPEVKEKDKKIDSLARHSKGISMRVIKYPSKDNKYYIISVGYDSDLRFETYFSFYVWPESMEIRYLDPDTNRPITLSEWRRARTHHAQND